MEQDVEAFDVPVKDPALVEEVNSLQLTVVVGYGER